MNARHSQISVLAIGDFSRAEFQPTLLVLRTQAELVQAASVERALDVLCSRDFSPHLIVIAQAWPGEFTLNAIDRLRKAAPLARVFELAGTLCEGALRSGKPWPAVLRCYSHQGAVRFEQQFARLAHALPVDWEFPVTAGEEERLIARADEPVEKVFVGSLGAGVSGEPDRVLVVAEDRAWSAALGDTLAERGFRFAVVRPGVLRSQCEGDVAALPTTSSPADVAAILWDTNSAELQCREAIDRVRTLAPDAPLIATVGFPRPEAILAALSHGIAHVISKPLDIDELMFLLVRGSKQTPPASLQHDIAP